MKHILDRNASAPMPVCGAIMAGDELVVAALQSDCDECRVAVGVLRVGDSGYGGRPVGVSPAVDPYEPQPLEGDDSEAVAKRRDGR